MQKLLVVIVLVLAFKAGWSQSRLNNLDDKNVIIDGYDPVAFFTDKRPVKGSAEFQSEFDGAIYYFSSAENKALFERKPEMFKVQFGGYCAYAVSQGHVSPIDPKFCVTQKDANGSERLICQHNQKASDLWNKEPDMLFENAFRYWPKVVQNNGRQIPIKGAELFYLNVDKDGLAVGGYDVVSYHAENKAVKGESKFSERYHGAKYYFRSKENQLLFRNNPKQYLPQYGGFCAYAMSFGKVRPVDPTIFSIEEGRLMLQHTEEAFRLFKKDIDGNVKKADVKWPGVEKNKAGKKVKFDKPAKS
jgi:YHS domain-containing protein